VLIYRLGSLGDTVAALPCFHLVQRAFPHAERLVLTNFPVSSKAPPLEVILKEGGFIHGAIAYPVGMRNPIALARLATQLRRRRPSALVYLMAGRGLAAVRRDVAFFRLCGIRQIIGAPLTADLHENRVDAGGDLEPESHRLARTLLDLGTIELADRSWWDLRLTDDEVVTAAVELGPLATKPFVVVNTGGKALEKDWGEANWRALLEILGASFPERGLVFVGAHEDSRRAGLLADAWEAGEVVDLCGRLNPRESAAALARAELFIGHDSGPLHLADAVGTPCIGLFGSYNRPRMWHPTGEETRVIHRMEGLNTIRPDEVRDAVCAQLACGGPS
jgi:heptosyltransferase-3